MFELTSKGPLKLVSLGIAMILLATGSGCVTYATKTIPAGRLPLDLRGPSKSAQVSLNLAMLRQDPPPEYIIGPRDLLGVYLRGVLPADLTNEPIVHSARLQSNTYYPPLGVTHAPSMGVPIEVYADGTIDLPRADPIEVSGLTLREAAARISSYYEQRNITKPESERALVHLIKSRVTRVLVIREDAAADSPTLKSRQQVAVRRRGSAAVIDLPAFENDILHALVATGGLPGTDAYNTVWILRSQNAEHEALDGAWGQYEAGTETNQVLDGLGSSYIRTAIPLRICPGEPLALAPEDVILHDGDVVYLEPRDHEFFYTGGLLPAGATPLPRDHDVDILEAIALANGGVGAPAVGGSGVQNLIRAGAGPGNILIPPTRVIVVRKLADGQQVRIRADLERALHDPKERMIVQPDDLIMLQFKPGEIAGNTVFNWFGWGMNFVPTSLIR